jgi:hypothetical protein
MGVRGVLLGGFALAAVLAVSGCSGSSATPAPTGGAASSAGAGTSSGGGGTTAASGGTTAGGGGGAVTDANSALSQDAAASIIGGNVFKTGMPTTQGVSLAAYSNSSGGRVTAVFEKVPAGVGAAIMQAATGAAGTHGNLQTFSGLGDAAGKVVNANDATIVFVKDDKLVALYATNPTTSGTDLEARLQSVAQQVLGRM